MNESSSKRYWLCSRSRLDATNSAESPSDATSNKVEEKVAEAPEPVSEMVDEAPVKKAPARKAGQTKAEAKVEDEWVEDEDGNFVKKGD